MTPKPNGDVALEISQTWKVTGGHIPWVTVGLPNSNFKITGSGGNAERVYPYNGGGWSGAKVDLDKDYQPGQTFAFNFAVLQQNLLEGTSSGFKIKYAPGWYGSSITKAMTIKIESPIDAKNVTTDPKPTSIFGKDIVFERTNLGKGEQVWVTLNFPKDAFSKIPAPVNTGGSEGTPLHSIDIAIFIVAMIFGIGMWIIRYNRSRSDSDSHRPRRSYGIGPVVSPASYHSSDRLDSNGSSGSGSFGGRASSCHCVCACVSCACACACAGGGGGAGCARKGTHQCDKCNKNGRRSEPKALPVEGK